MKTNPHIFIMPTTDFAIKRIFRTERNKRFLIHFLNTFLSKYIGQFPLIFHQRRKKSHFDRQSGLFLH